MRSLQLAAPQLLCAPLCCSGPSRLRHAAAAHPVAVSAVPPVWHCLTEYYSFASVHFPTFNADAAFPSCAPQNGSPGQAPRRRQHAGCGRHQHVGRLCCPHYLPHSDEHLRHDAVQRHAHHLPGGQRHVVHWRDHQRRGDDLPGLQQNHALRRRQQRFHVWPDDCARPPRAHGCARARSERL